MSAFIVETGLIDALVTFATMQDHCSSARYLSLDEIGQVLVDQNYRSVNERYRKNDDPEKYSFRFFSASMSAIQIIKACDCYDHQACETDDYETTKAAEILREIRRKAISQLPGYDAAKWGMPDNPARRRAA